MDFDSPDVMMKDFPGLYAFELNKQGNKDSDYSDDDERATKKENLLIGKRKDKKDKDKGYAALEGESSADENIKSRSPSKSKKAKSFKFTTKGKEKRDKSREKEIEKKKDREKKSDKKGEKSKSEKTKKKEESADIGDILPIFGAPIELVVERSRCHDGIDIPLPLRQCIDYIESVGISFENVYKISGTKSKVLHIRKVYNERCAINLNDYDVPTVTSLLKTFLRDLPEPLLTNDSLIRFEEAGAILNLNTREKHLKKLVDHLQPCNKLVLSWLIIHLHNVSQNEKVNKMSKSNLAAALNHTFHCSSRLLQGLLHHAPALFPDVTITKYIPPLESGAKLPEEPSEIEAELRKQESLLSQIHKEVNICCISKQREELLWEVQRIITQLKRKLKSVNKEAEKAEHSKEETVIVKKEPTLGRPLTPGIETSHIYENTEVDGKIDAQQTESLLDCNLKLVQLKNKELCQLRDTLFKNLEKERAEIGKLESQISYPLPCTQLTTTENLDEIMDLFFKENQVLQIKKINLVRQIIEEQETCINMKAQLMANTVLN